MPEEHVAAELASTGSPSSLPSGSYGRGTVDAFIHAVDTFRRRDVMRSSNVMLSSMSITDLLRSTVTSANVVKSR